MNFSKLRDALGSTIGKTVAGVVLVEHEEPEGRFQVYLVFADNTHYELYGSGYVNGARGVDAGGLAEVCELAARTEGTVVVVKRGDSETREASRGAPLSAMP